jgi:AcrR family transcriptional regulator
VGESRSAGAKGALISERPEHRDPTSTGAAEAVGAAEERRALFDALLELCLQRGYGQIEIADLLERANLPESAFRRHFSDLEDCFCAKLEDERELFFAAVTRALRDQVLWVDRLRAAAYALLRFLEADERRRHFLTTELNAAGERAKRIWTETIAAPLLDLLDQGRAERDDQAIRSRTTAEAVGGGIFMQLTSAAERGQLDEAGVPKLMYSAVLPYLGPEAAERELSIPPPPTTGSEQ